MSSKRIVLRGTGGVVAPALVPVATMLSFLQAKRPDGKLVSAGSVKKMFGIDSLSHFTDPSTGLRLTREQGGMTDTQLAITAVERAIERSGFTSAGLRRPSTGLVHLSCTPSRLHLCNGLGDIVDGVGLRGVHAETHDLGCAAVAYGIHQLEMMFSSTKKPHQAAILVASNAVEGAAVGHPELYERARNHKHEWAWATALFSSAAGAAVFEAVDEREAGTSGLLASWYETQPIELVNYPAGGSDRPPSSDTLGDHGYLMHADVVGKEFVPCISRAMAKLQEDWPTQVQPVVGVPFSMDAVSRFYFHQSNLGKIHEAAGALGIPLDKLPTNIERLGNTTCPSTLLLLDDDVRQGRLKKGDIVVFLVVGAGLGAMYGYAVLVI